MYWRTEIPIIVRSLIDDFDKNYTLSGISNPAGYTMLMVEALPSG